MWKLKCLICGASVIFVGGLFSTFFIQILCWCVQTAVVSHIFALLNLEKCLLYCRLKYSDPWKWVHTTFLDINCPDCWNYFDVNVSVSVNDEVTWACPELTCNTQGLIWFPWPCRHRFSLRCFNMTILWFPLFVNPNMKRLLDVAWSPPTELLPSCCIFFNSQAKSREI